MKLFLIFGGIIILLVGGIFLFASNTSFEVKNPLLSMLSPSEKSERVAEEKKEGVAVLFGGDMQFDRYIRTVMKTRGNGFVLAPLTETLHSADLVVANLEGPITDSSSVSEISLSGEAKNYVFTFPPTTGAFLKKNHIDLVNIGNNHILNFKVEGVLQTKKYLSEAGVDSFGSPLEGDERIFIKEINGTKIAFVNYNQFIWKGKEKAFEDLNTVRGKADFTVVFTHWGTEYIEATDIMKMLAHDFIDAGADIVIGTHPHVVQTTEEYKGKKIYYSLGNFIFDQYFRPETQSGLLVRATFDPVAKGITTNEIPIRLKSSGQTVLQDTH
ncbi:MAG: CapA family protein [Candidatus Moraniibacteriota bacterium]